MADIAQIIANFSKNTVRIYAGMFELYFRRESLTVKIVMLITGHVLLLSGSVFPSVFSESTTIYMRKEVNLAKNNLTSNAF